MIYFQGVFGLLFYYSLAAYSTISVLTVPGKYRKIIIARAFFGYFGIMGMWGAVKYMPIFIAQSIIFT